MCGRFTMYADDAELTTLFDIDLVEGEHAPSYNQAPSELIRAVRSAAEAERLLTSQQCSKPCLQLIANRVEVCITDNFLVDQNVVHRLLLDIGVALKRLVDVIAGLRKPIDLARQPAPSATAQIQQLPLGPDLAPLQHELAALLARNALVVERARSHAADLNHALKKPLSLLMAHAGSEAAVPSHTVLGQTTAMARLIDRYQARIHSDAKPEAADQAVEVLACTAQMLAMMRQLHQAQGLDWQWLASSATPALWWRGARADLEELLGNVLDNAGKWAASRVQVRVQRVGEGLLQVLVDDDGPGMTEAQMHAAGERGRRFDESVAGTGLGLSIAQQIVQSYDGSLQLRQSDALKGLQVQMVLGGLLG